MNVSITVYSVLCPYTDECINHCILSAFQVSAEKTYRKISVYLTWLFQVWSYTQKCAMSKGGWVLYSALHRDDKLCLLGTPYNVHVSQRSYIVHVYVCTYT